MTLYQSQKGFFQHYLHEEMAKNKDIWLISVDLGYGMWDRHFKDFPDRCINTGAAEQSATGIAVGLALSGKIPFVYSIPNFLIYRPYEWIRNYIDHENIPVKLIAGGRDDEYGEDGYTHQSCDLPNVLKDFPNLEQHWVQDKSEIHDLLKVIISNNKPTFVSLRRKA